MACKNTCQKSIEMNIQTMIRSQVTVFKAMEGQRQKLLKNLLASLNQVGTRLCLSAV